MRHGGSKERLAALFKSDHGTPDASMRPRVKEAWGSRRIGSRTMTRAQSSDGSALDTAAAGSPLLPDPRERALFALDQAELSHRAIAFDRARLEIVVERDREFRAFGHVFALDHPPSHALDLPRPDLLARAPFDLSVGQEGDRLFAEVGPLRSDKPFGKGLGAGRRSRLRGGSERGRPAQRVQFFAEHPDGLEIIRLRGPAEKRFHPQAIIPTDRILGRLQILVALLLKLRPLAHER